MGYIYSYRYRHRYTDTDTDTDKPTLSYIYTCRLLNMTLRSFLNSTKWNKNKKRIHLNKDILLILLEIKYIHFNKDIFLIWLEIKYIHFNWDIILILLEIKYIYLNKEIYLIWFPLTDFKKLFNLWFRSLQDINTRFL